MTKPRCPWVNLANPAYVRYHDDEWGVPVHDERRLFEMLILEGAQAGLSWETVLNKRARYRALFADFDPAQVAAFTDARLEAILQDPGVIRNRLKIHAARRNAAAFLQIQERHGSFNAYVWRFVDNQPLIRRPAAMADVPAQTPTSAALSKDLKRWGMTFVGPTIMYAFMQAVGMVDDHLAGCWKTLL